MQETQAGYGPTGENPSALISLGIVFEVQRIHRNPDPPAGWMMVFCPGAGVKDGRVEYKYASS